MRFVMLVVLGTVAVALVVHAVMAIAHWSAGVAGLGGTGLAVTAIGSRADTLAHDVLAMSGQISLTNGLGLACAAGAAVILVVGIAVCATAAARRLRPPPGVDVRTGRETALLVHWTLVVIALLVAAALSAVPLADTTDASGRIVASVRYLVPLPIAFAIMLPLWARCSVPRRIATAVAATLMTLTNAAAVAAASDRGDYRFSATRPLEAALPTLEHLGIARGYAGYWDAGPLTWKNDFALVVAPVAEDGDCGQPGIVVCPISYDIASGWYVPREGRSFLLINTASTVANLPLSTTFASATRTAASGSPDIEILVFDNDVASALAHSCAGRRDHLC
jgi:hypothetical protein